MNLKGESSSLRAAFETFSKESLRLEKAYADLKNEFHKLQEELRASLLTLESFVRHISQGIIAIKKEGEVSIYNPAAEALLGLKKEDVAGKPFSTSFSDSLFGFSMWDALQGTLPPHITLLHLEKGKQILEIEVTTTLIQGKEEGIILLLRDLTEIRFLEKAAKRGDRLKELGEMAAGLAHEIRNPLAGIEGFAALLEQDLKKERPELAAKTTAIIEGTRCLNRLVTNVLEYSRPLQPKFERMDLKKLALNVCNHLCAESARYKKRIVIEAKAQSYPVHADPDLIRLSLFNLVLNGLQASKNGEVKILLRKLKEGMSIVVADRGPGILPHHLENIFTPFFTTKTNGTGLGLSEVHKAIEAHGGTISVDSKAGEGARFEIKLPLCRKI